jgi:hypothetical protein
MFGTAAFARPGPFDSAGGETEKYSDEGTGRGTAPGTMRLVGDGHESLWQEGGREMGMSEGDVWKGC